MGNFSIELFDETETLSPQTKDLVEMVLHTACKVEDCKEETEVSVTFVTNERIHELNKTYRLIDRPTDVLSFALNDDEDDLMHSETSRFLGDIIISLDKAREQSKEYQHSFERELTFLAVHGFLHLLGYDHQTEEDENLMTEKQEEILQTHGLKK